MKTKLVVMQNCGSAKDYEEYSDWKAGQEAIKEVSGYQYSYFNPSNGKIVGFYLLESIYGLKRGQKAVYQ